MTDRPKASPELDYQEKKVVDLRRCDTGDVQIIDLARDAKRRAKRRPKEIMGGVAAIIVALGGAITGITKSCSAHDRADVVEYRLNAAEKALDKYDGKLDRLGKCCHTEE